MIKALYFDIGGVLLRTEDLSSRRKWERRFGLRDWQLADLFFASPMGEQAQVGCASTAQAWNHVGQTLKLNDAELAELKVDFWRGDVFDRSLFALIQSLRPRYKTGVISNAMPDARENMKDGINGETFDMLVFSGEEGIKKPDPEIYRRALLRLGVQPNESVFVDDMAANIEAAKTLGMHGIQFTPGMDLQVELAKIGVL